MRVLELFGGIGACTQALKRLGIDFEVADYVEIDKYAVKSYNAINGTNFEPQDITKWNKDIEVDLIMHGSPCQDFSLAGQQAGGDEGSGTRSSLMYETIRIVKKLLPKYVIWENVKNILSKKHRHNFENYLKELRNLGYVNYYQVLNAKDYGIPQNRERVFTVSIRRDLITEDYQLKDYKFPEKQELKLRLKDLLEDEVDEKYYLSEKQIERIKTTNYNVGKTRIQEKNYCDTLCARDWKDPKCIQVGQLYGTEVEPNPQAGRIYDCEGISPTNEQVQKEKGNGFRFGVSSSNSNGDKTQIIEKSKVQRVCNVNPSGRGQNGQVVSSDGLARAVTIEKGEGQKILIENRVGHQVSQTLQCNDNMGVVINESKVIGGIGEKKSNGGTQWYQQDRIYDNNVGLSLSTTAQPYYPDKQLRIRKLTPKECWRLMGFSDESFEKASQVNSNSQLYKQAGNSIVVNVLVEIFRNLLEN